MPYGYSIVEIPYSTTYPCSVRKAAMDLVRQKVSNFLVKIGWLPYKSGGGGRYYEFSRWTTSSMRLTLTKAQLCTSVHPRRRYEYWFKDNNEYYLTTDQYLVHQYQLELFISRNEYLPQMSQSFTPDNLISICLDKVNVGVNWWYAYDIAPFYPWKVLTRYYDGSNYRILLESFPIKKHLFYQGYERSLLSTPVTSPLMQLTWVGFSPFTQTFVSRGENDDRPPLYITFDVGSFYLAGSGDMDQCYWTDVGFFYISDTYPHSSLCDDSDYAESLLLPTVRRLTSASLYLYGDKNFVIIVYGPPSFYGERMPLLCCGHVPVFAPIGKMRNEMKDVDKAIHRKIFTSADKLFYDYNYYRTDIQGPDPTMLYGKDVDYFIPFFFFGVDKPLSDDVPLFHSHFLGFSLPWMLVRVTGGSNHPDFCVFGRVYSGISTGGNTAETLNDTNANWDTDVFKGKTLALVGGTGGFGQVRKIISNSRTRLIVDRPFDVIPNNTTKYVICNFFYRKLQFNFVPWNERRIIFDWFSWFESPSFYCLEHPDYYVEV